MVSDPAALKFILKETRVFYRSVGHRRIATTIHGRNSMFVMIGKSICHVCCVYDENKFR
jgi:hypothetical protein